MVRTADTKSSDISNIMKDIIRDNTRARDNFSVAVDYGTGSRDRTNVLQQTLSSITETMQSNMEGIVEDGIFNGMPIKNAKDLRFRVEQAIQPALRVMAKLHDANNLNSGWGKIDVPYEQQDALGTHEINLDQMEKEMRGTIDDWMNSVAGLEWETPDGQVLRGKDIIGLPLAINDTNTRGEIWTELYHGRDVVSATENGYVPKAMITDAEAQDKMDRYAAKDASERLDAIVATHPMPQ